jgi:hypothetical protein
VKETASGPFVRENTTFPAWAPDLSDTAAAQAYVESLCQTGGQP